MDRILLLVVDGCTPRVLGPALARGELPVLAALAARGTLHMNCASIFPSITPAATASIITGHYPSRHAIAGMSWWDPATGAVSYFGDDVWTILRRGIATYVRDFLLGLNGDRLQAPTLFEIVERHDRRAASFNYIVFRGNTIHRLRPPLLLRLLRGVDSNLQVRGPSWLCLGDFLAETGGRHITTRGAFHRFGFDDDGTAAFLRTVPEVSALPDFSVAYFADYDFQSHDAGPAGAISTLHRLDSRLGEIFTAWGGLDRVVEDLCVVVTADHSHSDVGDGTDAGIALETVLSGYRCADPASGWTPGDDLLLCPNMRAAEIYLRRPTADAARAVCRRLLEEPRIDQIIWREQEGPDAVFRVETRDRGSLRIRQGDAGAYRDEYGGRWRLHGDLSALDVSVDAGAIRYGAYPNAVERIVNGIDHPRAGRLWATARPGHEFSIPGQDVHRRGGSHGSLHALDSLVPLLVAGRPGRQSLAFTPRIVDVAPLCAGWLGVPFDVVPGAPRR